MASPVRLLVTPIIRAAAKDLYKKREYGTENLLTLIQEFTNPIYINRSVERYRVTMDSPRILKTRNSNIIYQVVKKNRSPMTTSTSPKRNSKAKSKPRLLENIEGANKLAWNSPPCSPTSSIESLPVKISDSDDSDEEFVELPLQSQSVSNTLGYYKDRVKELAKTYKEFIDRSAFPEAQQTNIYPACKPSSRSISPFTLEEHNRPSQDDIRNARLLLLLRVVE